MSFRSKRKGLMGVVGGLGVAAFLAAVPGQFYSLNVGIFLALAIWIIGATTVNLLTR